MSPLPADSTSDESQASPPRGMAPSESVLELQTELKQEVEDLARNLDRMRGILQTLVFGLLIVVSVAFSATFLFAYRLMVQERREQAEMAQMMETEVERSAQIEEMQAQLQTQQQLLQALQQQLPAEFTTLTDTVQSNQRQLQLLRDRVLQAESQLQILNPTPLPSPIPSPQITPSLSPDALRIGPVRATPAVPPILFSQPSPPGSPQASPTPALTVPPTDITGS